MAPRNVRCPSSTQQRPSRTWAPPHPVLRSPRHHDIGAAGGCVPRNSPGSGDMLFGEPFGEHPLLKGWVTRRYCRAVICAWGLWLCCASAWGAGAALLAGSLPILVYAELLMLRSSRASSSQQRASSAKQPQSFPSPALREIVGRLEGKSARPQARHPRPHQARASPNRASADRPKLMATALHRAHVRGLHWVAPNCDCCL
jgi:hypothetical protein